MFQHSMCHFLHIKDYVTAQAMTEEWLQDKNNQCQHEYEQVVELYIKNVLLPANMIKQAQDFLGNCASITNEKKQVYRFIRYFIFLPA